MTYHWTNESSNPNDTALRHARSSRIRSVTAETTVDRIDLICNLAKGRSVLDVGCVSHEVESEKSEEWLHRKIADCAARCVGVDILEEGVSELREKGYNVSLHDLALSPMDQCFDLIVCGEIIEHLPQPGPFMENCGKSLEVGGKMVITTPYPWFLGTVLRNMIRGSYLSGSMDHVAWFDPATITEICDRHGFTLRDIRGINPMPSEKAGGLQELIYKAIRARLVPFISPLSGCRSLLYLLEKTER